MLYTWLSMLIMIPNSYYSSAFVGVAVPLKKGRRYPIVVTLFSTLSWILNHMVFPQPLLVSDIAIYIVTYVALFHYTDRGQRFHAFLTQTLLLLVDLLGVFLGISVLLAIRSAMGLENPSTIDIGTPLHTLGCLIVTVFMLPVLYLVSKLIKKMISGGILSPKLLGFMIIPISQMFLVSATVQYAYQYATQIGVAYFPADVLFVILLSVAADVAFVLMYRHFRKAEMLKLSMEQARQQLDLQNSYYRELQHSILSVNQIRHDLNNQLQAAYSLLRQGEHAQVEQQLDLLRSSIRQRVGTHYCENMMVDAILTDKVHQCQQLGTEPEISVFLPAEISIENAHLCSLFANLMDNSLHALQDLGGGKLVLHAELHGNTLAVSCANSARAPEKKVKKQDLLRPHGLGLDILRHLTEIYRGHMQTQYRDGIFTVSIVLYLPEHDPVSQP